MKLEAKLAQKKEIYMERRTSPFLSIVLAATKVRLWTRVPEATRSPLFLVTSWIPSRITSPLRSLQVLLPLSEDPTTTTGVLTSTLGLQAPQKSSVSGSSPSSFGFGSSGQLPELLDPKGPKL